MQKYRVKLNSVRSVIVTVELEDNAHPTDVEDAAADLYYRGDVTFPEGSPSLDPVVLSGLPPERVLLERLQSVMPLFKAMGLDTRELEARILLADAAVR